MEWSQTLNSKSQLHDHTRSARKNFYCDNIPTIKKKFFNFRHLIEVFEFKMNRRLEQNGQFLDIRISPSTFDFFCGDPQQINNLLDNLCSHGACFSGNGVLILDIDFLPISEKHYAINLVLTISGSRIPRKVLQTIFQPEIRLGRKDESFMLPKLFIAKTITSTMGGEISVENTFGFGTRYNAMLKMEVAGGYEMF